jgi:hypothetical protein
MARPSVVEHAPKVKRLPPLPAFKPANRNPDDDDEYEVVDPYASMSPRRWVGGWGSDGREYEGHTRFDQQAFWISKPGSLILRMM